MSPSPPRATWHPMGAVAAWLLPGFGHWWIGQHRHAVILGSAIGSTWLLGLLVGGIDVINYNQTGWWFVAQMLTGPSVLVDRVRERIERKRNPDQTTPALAYEPSLGRSKEQGALFTALAGLLNLLAIIDVLYRDGAPPAVRGAT